MRLQSSLSGSVAEEPGRFQMRRKHGVGGGLVAERNSGPAVHHLGRMRLRKEARGTLNPSPAFW